MKVYVLFATGLVTIAVFISGFFLIGETRAAPVDHDTTLTTTVLEYLTFDLTSGDTVPFGDLTPGTPIKAPSGATVASVTTNAVSGYTLGLHDGHASTDSSMTHSDTTTHIAKYAGTIGTPTAWSSTGVGITNFAGGHKDAKWGTGTTYDDANNKYAGIPETATTAYTANAFHASADTSSWAFEIDVPNTQKTGAYSGTVTFTATAVVI